MSKENQFYVYIYLDPRKPSPFKFGNFIFLYEPIYVGKGIGKRYKQHKWRRKNPIKKAVFEKIELVTGTMPPVIFYEKNLTEEKAFELEMKLIEAIGRKNIGTGSLTNLTDGGEGVSGHEPWNKGKKMPYKERKPLCQIIKNEIIELYKDYSLSDISKIISEKYYKISQTKINSVLKRNGVELRQKNITTKDMWIKKRQLHMSKEQFDLYKKIGQMYLDGKGIRSIAKKIDSSFEVIKRMLVDMDLFVSGRSGRIHFKPTKEQITIFKKFSEKY